jgi:Family of unknown function (DUF5681)
MRVEEGLMTKLASLSENSQANGAQPSDASPDYVVDDRRPPVQEKMDDERLVDDSTCGVAQALPTRDSNALSECDSWFGANDEWAPAQSNTDRVDRVRLPNGQWRPGVSGNPKGRKPKTSPNDGVVTSALEQALDKKIKVKRSGKESTVTKGSAILEQWVNQAVQGDHRARRELIAYADKHGIDLFAGQHKTIREGVTEAGRTSSTFTLTEEVLDRLSQGTLTELTRVVTELEAERKKKLH